VDLVSKAFKIRTFEGLGKVFVCKLCNSVFVSAKDCESHLKFYHKVFSEKKLNYLLEQEEYFERVKKLWSSVETARPSSQKALMDFVKS